MRFDPAKVRVLWAPFWGMQTRVIAAPEFEVGIGGAKGPGKSDCGVMAGTRQIGKERYKALVTRETGPQLLELIDRSHRIFPKMAQRPAWNGETRRWTWPSGATMKFEAIGTVDDVDRITGQEWGYVFQDEVGNIPDERVVDLVQAEIRCPDPTVIRMWRGSANPGKSGHAWFKRRFVNPCGRDGHRIIIRKVTLPNGMVSRLTRRFIPGTVLDNPIYANDPLYMAQLATLPEVLRKQLLYGDWDAGFGAALQELDEAVHLVRRFKIPDFWTRFGSFDYGFAHLWVWCSYAVSEDGVVYVEDTVRGRRHLPHQIAERVKSRVPVHHPSYLYTVSDPYPFQSKKELKPDEPTIADRLAEDHDLVLNLRKADRKAGLQNLRYYLAWRGIGRDGADALPALRFFDTPGNRWLFDQLQAMVVDPDDPEDVLKVDANTETGEGGDDGYESLRNGMATRPPRAIGQWYDGEVTAFSQQTLAHMVEVLYRDQPLPQTRGASGDLATFLTGV